MPTFFRSVNRSPTQANGSSTDDVWFAQYHASRPGALVKLSIGTSTPSADTGAYFELSAHDAYLALRMARNDRLYAWGDYGGTLVVNRD